MGNLNSFSMEYKYVYLVAPFFLLDDYNELYRYSKLLMKSTFVLYVK